MSQNHRLQPLPLFHRIGRVLIIASVLLGSISAPNLARMVSSQNSFEKNQALIKEREQELLRGINLSKIYSVTPALVKLVYTETKTHLQNFYGKLKAMITL